MNAKYAAWAPFVHLVAANSFLLANWALVKEVGFLL